VGGRNACAGSPAVRSARNFYRLSLAVAALGLVAAIFAAATALRGFDLSPVSPEQAAVSCQRFLVPHLTIGSAVSLVLGLLGGAVVALAVRSAVKQLSACRRFMRGLDVIGELEVDGTKVAIIACMRPEAFCAGLLRPRIYLSSAGVEMLLKSELEAVVAHERHHRLRKDPLRILLVGVLADALFFLPALRQLKRRYEELAELAADEAALTATRDPAPLAAALLRFGERGAPGVVGIAPERVDQMFGAEPRWQLPVSLVSGAGLTVAALLAFAATSAHETAVSGSSSLTLLAAQSCMLVMAALPTLVLAAAVVLGCQAVSRRRRGSAFR
jgi:Zn-dependent protease with chaperone function